MNERIKGYILLLSNTIISLGWLRVVLILLWMSITTTKTSNDDWFSCAENPLRVSTVTALYLSCIELVTSVVGLTRSIPWQVMVFAGVRSGVEYWVAPFIGCDHILHLSTVLFWSFGDFIRFGCFAVDGLLQSVSSGGRGGKSSTAVFAKSVRYTVGPILFPLGAIGEMSMVLRAASRGGRHRPLVYLAASLWPICFYPLMKQLIKQRRKHFASVSSGTKPKKGNNPVIKQI